MTLLISQNRAADQNYNLFYFILGEQLFKLTAIDMRTALINELLDRSQRTARSLTSNFTFPSSSCIDEVSHPFGACLIQERYQTR